MLNTNMPQVTFTIEHDLLDVLRDMAERLEKPLDDIIQAATADFVMREVSRPVTVKEAAKLARVSEAVVRKRIRTGVVPSQKINGRVLLPIRVIPFLR
jgi:hypothetical protein